MMRPHLVVLSRAGRASIDARCWAELEEHAKVTVVRRDQAPDHSTACRLLADADLMGATNLCLPKMDAALLDRLPRLRGIVLYATGYDHLDVAQLRARGVGLSILPEYATIAVAEHAVALLLALATRLHLAHDRSRGAVSAGASLRGMELAGKTVGIVGVGRIGSHVARLSRGIGMTVAGTDIDPCAVSRAEAAGVVMGSLDWLVEHCDALIVCASHEFAAPPIVRRRELVRLRTGALLVNVSRSALVDTAAAVQAVRSGQLRGYAVDDTVLDVARDGDLLTEGRILQTGHSAWWRDEVLRRGARMWGERLLAAVRGLPLDAVTWTTEDCRRSPVVAPTRIC